MEILELIDRAEALVGASTKVPLAQKRMINTEDMLDLIDQMRAAVPQDIKEAAQVLQKRDSVVNQALMQAKAILGAAEEEARIKVRESSITKDAESHGGQITAEAERKAANIVAMAEKQAQSRRQDADKYALQVLRDLDARLGTALEEVEGGMNLLEKGQRSREGAREEART
ncbi:MAG: hypothetical protein HY330_00425 [Chloroflexi bacterium]|nr:hypothetical protein [Chloroflexota bacterium]